MDLKNYGHNPQWLTPLLQTEFYVPCIKHRSNPVSYFCIDCSFSQGFCKICNDEIRNNKNSTHKGHQTIQIFRASHEPGLRITKVSQLLDISNIHTYIINSKRIVYINTRRGQRTKSRPGTKNIGDIKYCVMCRWNLLQKDSKGLQQKYSKFCSIECKARFLSWELDREERYEVVDQDSSCSSKATKMNDIQAYLEDESVNNMQASTELEDQSVKKRRRKGIPKRSPLF